MGTVIVAGILSGRHDEASWRVANPPRFAITSARVRAVFFRGDAG
jgi:hypothetical protein